MGTWGIGCFDNDDALDWLSELSESSDLELIATSLNPAKVNGYYLEAPECVRILCAGEVLAALRGKPAASLPDKLRTWTATNATLDPSRHLQAAVQKVDRVLAEHSELDELWKENEGDYPQWRASVLDLRSRLGG